ncbi:unnamed protein product [Trichobilharzia regenti]|nr:unnamed protein product [Trichobilharzia regenti]
MSDNCSPVDLFDVDHCLDFDYFVFCFLFQSHLLSEDGSLHDTSSLMDFDGLFQYQGRQNQQFLYDCFTMPTHGGNLIRMKSCSSHLPAICTYTLKSKVSPVNVKHTADLPPCPTGWISFKDNCYWLPFPLVRLGWSEAERTCQSQGSLLPSESPILAHLASIHSSEEAQFLTSLSLSLSFWTGLKLYMSSDNPLSSTVSLAWSDKSPFDYSAFQSPASTIQQNGSTSPNLLSHLENLENCIAVSGEHNYWDIENCIEDKSFICQLPKTALLPSTVKMPTEGVDHHIVLIFDLVFTCTHQSGLTVASEAHYDSKTYHRVLQGMTNSLFDYILPTCWLPRHLSY